MRNLILAIALFAAPATAAHAGELSGKVFDATALPVAGAVVSIEGREAVTQADGSYRFEGLAEGQYEVAVALADGAVQRMRAAVAEEGTARRNIFLVSPAALAGAEQFAAQAAVEAVEMPALPDAGAVAVAVRWRDTDA